MLAYCKGYFSTGSILLRYGNQSLSYDELQRTPSLRGSIALSVKMNILLYLPGVLVIIVKSRGVFQTIYHVVVILAVQILLAIPFLKEYPREYLQNAFQFSRVFLFKWTVNWRFVPESVFLSRAFGLSLLGAHLTILIAFALARWCQNDGGALRVLRRGLRRPSLAAGIAPVTPDGFCSH
jgi:alpha-1,3-mannosyltransferase